MDFLAPTPPSEERFEVSNACLNFLNLIRNQVLAATRWFSDSGLSFVAAVLIDAGTDTEKILRVTLPLGMRLADGTWIAVDHGEPMNAPYTTCVTLGCVADYQANSELIYALKEGNDLVIGAVDSEGQVVSFALPLLDFGKAYGGSPTDRKGSEDHH
jgi:invasion protein IalB